MLQIQFQSGHKRKHNWFVMLQSCRWTPIQQAPQVLMLSLSTVRLNLLHKRHHWSIRLQVRQKISYRRTRREEWWLFEINIFHPTSWFIKLRRFFMLIFLELHTWSRQIYRPFVDRDKMQWVTDRKGLTSTIHKIHQVYSSSTSRPLHDLQTDSARNKH